MPKEQWKTSNKKCCVYTSIKNKNVVNEHIHKAKWTSKKEGNKASRLSRSAFDMFQPCLPTSHPLVNAPVQSTPFQNPANFYVNPITGAALTNNTPVPSVLAMYVYSN